VEKITLELPVKLTAEELMEKGQKMATAILKYDEYEAEKKEIAADLGDKMKKLHAELTALGTVVDRKTEDRPVVCKIELNQPEDGMKTIWRQDTGEAVKEEKMTAEDRQEKLPLEEPVTVN
jgi:hypothetical protein